MDAAPPVEMEVDAVASGGGVSGTQPQLAIAPVEIGGWKVIASVNRWIKLHAEEMKIGAHCEVHGKANKMDRQMSRGTVGLAHAWRKKGLDCSDRAAHIIEKAVVSSHEGLRLRTDARVEMQTRGENEADPTAGRICEMFAAELEARPTDEMRVCEPHDLPCPDISRELARFYESQQ